ncbi:MAG: MFS transporter [Gemmatimonadetes bacterium]|nr:MFS transporter [Gemmatimonadota bacterium]
MSSRGATAPPLPAAGIPATVKGLALVSLFNDFASEMVYPLLPAFVVGTLGGSPGTLAALDGAADLAAAATKWVSGGLADRPGWRKPLILVGYASAVLMRPLIAAASAAWQVVGFRVLDRVGKGLRTPARDAMIADATPPGLRGRAFGFHRAADHFGSIPGALIAWWLVSHAMPVRTVLSWSILPGLVAALILVVVLRAAPSGRAATEPPSGARQRPRPGPCCPPTPTPPAGPSGPRSWRSRCWCCCGCPRPCCCSGCRTWAWPWPPFPWCGPACTWCGASVPTPGAGWWTTSAPAAPWPWAGGPSGSPPPRSVRRSPPQRPSPCSCRWGWWRGSPSRRSGR